MAVLLLTLAGPMQAWGSQSRWTTRATDDAPTKSGVIGLLAAARGLRRADPLEDLLQLRFGVRIDQPGELLRDFQTARTLDGSQSMPLSYRYYRADARYLVGLEGEHELLSTIAESLRRPVYPLYLGRRSCPPAEPLSPTLREGSLEAALQNEPWLAAEWWKKKLRGDSIVLEFRIDADGASGELLNQGVTTVRDAPISFNPENRLYGWRSVSYGWITIGGPQPPIAEQIEHDAMGEVI